MTENRADHRRTAITTGALASGALALGLGVGEMVSAQQTSSALVFGYDYSPRRQFEEVARLQQGTTDQILQAGDESMVDQPDEWTGFIARYRQGDDYPGELFLAFSRDGPLGQGEFDIDATYFEPEANLLRVSITEGDGDEAETTTEEETTTEAEGGTTEGDEAATTPAEGETETTDEAGETRTTEDVVVETTTAEDGDGE